MSEVLTTLYKSDLLQIGTFRCPVDHPRFENTRPIAGYMLVFPRTSVYITHIGRAPVIADPNIVMFYNKGQIYNRGKLSERGDLCDWFAFHPGAITAAVRPYDPAVVDRGERPFIFTHGPSHPHSYLRQRMVVKHIRQAQQPDHLYIEETMLSVLNQVMETTYEVQIAPIKRHHAGTRKVRAELVHAVKTLLVTRFRESLSLTQIAQEVYSSPYHLCRIFRQQTGMTIHKYLNQIRLRTSLEYVAQSDTSITDLGLDLGYSSHSHFTQAFRRTFGASPSTLRQVAATHHLQQMSKILTV